MLLSRAQFADSAIRYGGTPLPVSWTNLALGIAVSLVLHGLLIAFFRTGWMPHAVPHILPPPTMTVWLRMEPPPAPPETLPPPPVVLTEPVLPAIRQQRELPHNKADKKAAPAMTWVPPRVNKPDNAAPSSTAEAGAGAADPFYPSAPASPGRFDVEAARRAARRFADEPDPAKAGTALAQLPPKKLATETPLARSIRAAGRGDCKDGIPGGLLAPLVLALDKKDHGCKW